MSSFAVVWSVKGRPKITKAHPAIQTLIYPFVKTEQKKMICPGVQGQYVTRIYRFCLLLLLFGR